MTAAGDVESRLSTWHGFWAETHFRGPQRFGEMAGVVLYDCYLFQVPDFGVL